MSDNYLDRMRRTQGMKRNSDGAWLCQRCQVAEVPEGENFECLPCKNVTAREAAERERQREQVALENARRTMANLIERAPIWQQCPRLPDDLSKMPREIRRMVDRYEPKQSLLISGPPGSWKTMGVLALIHRLKQDALEAAGKLSLDETEGMRQYMPSGEYYTGNFFVRPPKYPKSPSSPTETILAAIWVSALDLVQARRQHPLGRGEDAELITWAKCASILIIDEAGPQAQADRDQVLMEVVDARYRRQVPTIVTTGMSPEQFQAAHGGGLWRRLTETGVGRLLKVTKPNG